MLSGAGRCNILPLSVNPDTYVTDSSKKTLRKILLSWPLEEVRAFFEGPVGLRLIAERRTGKVFPALGGAEVRRRLLMAVQRVGVHLKTRAMVADISPTKRCRIILKDGETIWAERVIIATGGLSYPQTGSDGTGLKIAGALGHRIVEPYPALVALRSGSHRHRCLAGLSLPVTLAVGKGKGRALSSGCLLFTHRGYSGPAVLNIGHLAARAERNGQSLPITVSWSERAEEEWNRLLSPRNRTVRGFLKEILPHRLVDTLLAELGLAEERLFSLQREDRRRLIEYLTAYPLAWQHAGGFDEAEVTGGGVHLSEVEPRTLRSRRVQSVYFCGEILDAFGPIGGTNFLWAFVTGKCAGEGAAEG